MKQEKHRCDHIIYGDWARKRQCSRTGTVMRKNPRGGKQYYCKTHDPIAKERKDAEELAKYKAERKRDKENHERRSILFEMAKDIPTKQLHKFVIVERK